MLKAIAPQLIKQDDLSPGLDMDVDLILLDARRARSAETWFLLLHA